MSLEDLTLIIDNENISDFIFEENSFAYKDLKVSIDEIKYVRDTYMLSMGSCSFDEPLKELRELKLL